MNCLKYFSADKSRKSLIITDSHLFIAYFGNNQSSIITICKGLLSIIWQRIREDNGDEVVFGLLGPFLYCGPGSHCKPMIQCKSHPREQ
jgi:hypothetical protein